MPEKRRAPRRRRRRPAAMGAALAALALTGSAVYAATRDASAMACAGPLWKTTYYANTKFSGATEKSCDAVIDEDYGSGAPPVDGVPSDNFGVRWETSRDFGSGGPFRFEVAAQDAVRVYLDGKLKAELSGDVSTVREETVDLTVPKGKHTIRVDYAAFTGDAGISFAYTPRASADVDKVAPLKPDGGKITYDKATGQAKLTWRANAEMDLAGYRVNRRLSSTKTWTTISGDAPIDATTFTDGPPATGDKYYYAIVAVDEAGNVSPASSSLKVTTTDLTAPAAPTGLVATETTTALKLTWTKVTDAKTYRVYRATSADGDYTALGTTTKTTLTDSTAAEGGSYHYRVTALDRRGNESAPSDSVNGTRGDHTAPAVPTGLTAEGTEAGNVLDWTANTDDTVEYGVYAKRKDATAFALLGTVTESALTDADAEQDVATEYYVVALDKAGNTSAASEHATATRPVPPDTTAPVAPTGLTAEAGDLKVALDWTAPADADVAGYKVYRDGAPVSGGDLLTATKYTDTTAAEGVTYSYTVTAVDTSGNESPASEAAGATTTAWPVRDLTVGEGGYATVQEAVDAATSGQTILVKPGTYTGVVTVPKTLTGLTILGGTFDAKDTVITEAHGPDKGFDTFSSATFFARGEGLTVKNLTVENAYEEGTASNQQAVALFAEADRQTYANVRLLGHQDTLYVSGGRQYFTGSYIAGDTDFIFGDGTAVIDASEVHVVGGRKNGGSITAARTDAATPYGILITGSAITADDSVTQFYLGRPWGPKAQVTVRETSIAGSLRAAWRNWNDTQLWTDARYSEYLNTGAGATVDPAGRIQLTDAQAKQYTKARYLKGSDGWDPTGTLATEDFTAPEKVGGVTATAGTSGITVGWSAPAAPDLAGYRVYRDGTLISGSSPLSGAATSYEDTTALSGTAYAYTVTAVDTSGNESPVSDSASATWASPSPPQTTESPSPSASVSQSPSQSASPSESPSPSETVKTVPGADAVVDADGSGTHTTVQAAVDAAPASSSAANPYVIAVNPGTYRETVVISKAYTYLIGAGTDPSDTVVVYDNAAGTTNPATGTTYGTQNSRTMFVSGKNSRVENLTISNDFDEAAHNYSAEQAVALLTQADRLVFEDVRLLGNQDTIFLKSTTTANPNRVYFHDSYIEGDVDFLCGYATAVFDDSTFKLLNRGSASNNGYLAAPSTDSSTRYGFLVIDSKLTSNAPAGTFHLGRPWVTAFTGALGSLVVRDSELPAAIKSAPYADWSASGTTYPWENSFFREYNNTGAGADNSGTNTERPQLTESEAANFEIADYLSGSDGWAPQS